jgi:EAL domain-containing protein (putative c-di-GMP-specific phosphodiesterase class I)
VHTWDERGLSVGNGVAEFQLALLGETHMQLETRELASANSMAPTFIEFVLRYTPADGAPALLSEPGEAAQRLGLGEKFDRWVVARAFAAIVKLHQQGNAGAVYGVSVTASTISNVGLVTGFAEQATELAIAPGQVCFQIDELALMTQPAQTTEFARALRANGFLVALDRFTGALASFEYLRHLSLDYLKLAPNVNAGQDAADASHDLAVTRAMQSYAAAKSLTVVMLPAEPERSARLFDGPRLQTTSDISHPLH